MGLSEGTPCASCPRDGCLGVSGSRQVSEAREESSSSWGALRGLGTLGSSQQGRKKPEPLALLLELTWQ